MRPESTRNTPEERSNALWGKGTRGNEARSNALWGKAGRGVVTLAALAFAFALPMSGAARTPSNTSTPYVPSGLLAQAHANLDQIFHVIVQGTPGGNQSDSGGRNGHSDQVAGYVHSQISSDGEGGSVKRTFFSISGVSANLTGQQILHLSRNPHVQAITLDSPVSGQGVTLPPAPVATPPVATPPVPTAPVATPPVVPAPVASAPAVVASVPDSSMWLASTHADALAWIFDPLTGLSLGPAPTAPTIAIIDSGIDSSKVADFGSRIVASVNFSSLDPKATGDNEGHGTMVAGLAAGASAAYPGAAPSANLIDLRTADGNGQSVTSDVIAASDWILAHRVQYNIKVANFSMASASAVSFRFDPLDKAVERLWFAGVTVVAASGNHGTGTGPVDMSHSPGNDPFVITVGALDQQQTADPSDDTVPWWSAYGYTMDGFSKPDVSAPGRYMVAPVPTSSTLATTAPERVVAPGYMWMSGTSFAAPVVAGEAAAILAQHPDWGPDQVKGALMLTAAYLPLVDTQAAGVGEVDGGTAASLNFTPPNPNQNLDTYVVSQGTTGNKVFDQAAWSSAVASQAARSQAAWSSADWSSAAWSSAAWSSAAWSSAAWSSAAWSSGINSAMVSLASWSSGTMNP
jgi:serine protease AprX